MVNENCNGNIVLKEWPGRQTGEMFILTADGTIWKIVIHLPNRATGDRHGILRDNRVEEKP